MQKLIKRYAGTWKNYEIIMATYKLKRKILDYFLHSPKQQQIGMQQKELLKQEKMPKVLRI